VEFLDEGDTGHPLFVAGLNYRSDSQFHSGKYILGLAQGVSRVRDVKIFEGTRVLEIEPDSKSVRLETSGGRVRAERAFILTNALAPQFVRPLERAIRAERGQVFVTEPLRERPCHGSFGTTLAWWREIPEADGRYRLLFGGGRKRDEPDSLFRQFDDSGARHPKLEGEGFSPSPAHQQRLDEQFAKIFAQLNGVRVTHRWGGLQGFTGDSLPLVGPFDPSLRIHGMAGFCGRGNAHSDVGARYLAARVAGVETEFDKRYRELIDRLMQPNRPQANWSPWTGSND
jgi:gamma-glutamylputrescine oxidase